MNASHPAKLLALLMPALIILFLIAVQAHHFHSRIYRQDEAWVVHYALENIERVGLVNHILQIFHKLPPGDVLQDIWVHLFGHIENIVRYFSTLTTALTLAMFYRLAADLFDKRTAHLALILLGTLGIFVYYTHEARPYAALAFGTVGFQWALLRFIRRPSRRRAILTLLLAVVPFYQHPFLLYVYAAQLICILVFVRWNRELYRRGAALFGALALLIALRAYLNFFERSGIIRYHTETSLRGLSELYDYFKFVPEALGLFLLLGGFAIFLGKIVERVRSRKAAADPLMRFGGLWREGWVILSLMVMVALALLVNLAVPHVTPRNLLIAAPYLALIAAIALRRMHWQAQALALLFFCLPFALQFRPLNSNAGYWELANYIEQTYDPDQGRLVVMAPRIWQWIPIKYFLDERTHLGLSDSDIFYVTLEPQENDFAPQSLDESQFAFDRRGSHLQRLQTYLGERDKLWVIRASGEPDEGGDRVTEWIETGYSLYQAVDFPGENYYRALEVLEYRRHPDDAVAWVRFGDDVILTDWRLNDSVEVVPGQTISVDTWWATDAPLDVMLSSTLVIADQNGQGISHADDAPGGVYLTSIWRPGQLYFDERHLTIPDHIEAGEYPLLLGLYDFQVVENLPVKTAAGDATGNDLQYLTTLTVRR